MPNSKAFVIRSIKNGETSLIVSCYLEDIGYKTFIVKGVYGSKKSKFSKAHFFPLNIINLNYSYTEGKNLGFIKEVKTEKLYKSLHLDIQKSSVIIFLSEILNSIFKEETLVNNDLFNFLLNTLSWYDQVKSCNNFHLKFLIELSRFIGFYPNINNENDSFFNLESGSTSATQSIGTNIRGNDLTLFKEFLGTEFEDLNSMNTKNESRTRILNYIIDYYSLHLQMFKTPKSINVFAEIFK
ncbi:recombination protein O N-terminal domain-containing protein [Flavobacteriaceae bacterium]|nr:recombination protein O N-terminal domain-containing protein [Flavobacteriaceae bacterium]MDA8630299.1 recombination protein O N-terminal domain-containing protein [Flavobacteriaceae bacterium]MDA8704123.1 recombination protein O N-terminal domain-containing protein [Flavobacteriaceae bacterium]MDA9041790.1 recombination protein O N-terminal domain-containing protein [Flavobacteriaceae bacterium]MDA9084072.1 recombination protein O N-terminal domain-containing protein [Flavobacteriaceae bact